MEGRKEFETSNGKFLLQLLPPNAEEFLLENKTLVWGSDTWITEGRIYIGNGCEIMGLISELTEGQCEEVVDWNDEAQYYYKYPSKDWEGDITTTESFKSLCESLNIDLTQNWLLIKLL